MNSEWVVLHCLEKDTWAVQITAKSDKRGKQYSLRVGRKSVNRENGAMEFWPNLMLYQSRQGGLDKPCAAILAQLLVEAEQWVQEDMAKHPLKMEENYNNRPYNGGQKYSNRSNYNDRDRDSDEPYRGKKGKERRKRSDDYDDRW